MTDPSPFVRGVAWPGADCVPYPRADPADARRLPADTWAAACVPAGVRLEIAGSASTVEIGFGCGGDGAGYRSVTTWSVWRGDELVDEQPADGTSVLLRLGTGDGPATVHFPETMAPAITSLRAVDGTIEPAPGRPRWLAYGDSITEGWSATSPGRTWVALAGRRLGLDAVNLGYAGSARGELASAEQISALSADVITVAFGTNCWSMIPYTAGLARETAAAFLRLVRRGHPETPIVVVSPLIRPDAEDTPNRAGATLADLREAIEEAAESTGDVRLVPGLGLLDPADLVDGIHPGDAGHRRLADAIGPLLWP